jgi:hypothetical protein
MTFGQFNAMLAARKAAAEELARVAPQLDDLVAAPCVHPFEVTGMQWHARRTPGHLMVTIDYVCPDCGKTVARSKRDIKATLS